MVNGGNFIPKGDKVCFFIQTFHISHWYLKDHLYAAECSMPTYTDWILPSCYLNRGKLKAELSPGFWITGIFNEKNTKYKKRIMVTCTNTYEYV